MNEENKTQNKMNEENQNINENKQESCVIDWSFAEDGDAIYKNPETKEHYTKDEIDEFVSDLVPDEDPQDPFDWVGDVIHFGLYHRRYSFTRNNEKMNVYEFQDFVAEHIKDPEYIFIPVYMFEHGGISFSFGDFNDPFDSGMLGYVWAKLSELKDEYIVDSREEAIKIMKDTVQEVFCYWEGDVWYIQITDPSSDRIIAQSEYSVSGIDFAKKQEELMLEEVKSQMPFQRELVLD